MNERVKEVYKRLEKVEKEEDKSLKNEEEFYKLHEKQIKEQSNEQLTIVTAKLSNILQPSNIQKQKKINSKCFNTINLTEFTMCYLALTSNGKSLPMRLFVKKSRADMRLSLFFSRSYSNPSIDENDE